MRPNDAAAYFLDCARTAFNGGRLAAYITSVTERWPDFEDVRPYILLRCLGDDEFSQAVRSLLPPPLPAGSGTGMLYLVAEGDGWCRQVGEIRGTPEVVRERLTDDSAPCSHTHDCCGCWRISSFRVHGPSRDGYSAVTLTYSQNI